MVDETGRRPRGAGRIAFQQVIKGVAWANLTDDELIYAPRNPRPNHNYGFSPVEQIIVTINTAVRRQAAQLAYFTEGNTPAGPLNGPEGWNPDQIRDV
jgi:phage portal protein BeeE